MHGPHGSPTSLDIPRHNRQVQEALERVGEVTASSWSTRVSASWQISQDLCFYSDFNDVGPVPSSTLHRFGTGNRLWYTNGDPESDTKLEYSMRLNTVSRRFMYHLIMLLKGWQLWLRPCIQVNLLPSGRGASWTRQ